MAESPHAQTDDQGVKIFCGVWLIQLIASVDSCALSLWCCVFILWTVPHWVYYPSAFFFLFARVDSNMDIDIDIDIYCSVLIATCTVCIWALLATLALCMRTLTALHRANCIRVWVASNSFNTTTLATVTSPQFSLSYLQVGEYTVIAIS